MAPSTEQVSTTGDAAGGTVRRGSWAQVEAEAPELAARVRAAFGVRKHCTMATLRTDGTPRIRRRWRGSPSN